MKASEALRQSAELLICYETCRGLVTIFHETTGENVSAEPFHPRFMPRDTNGLPKFIKETGFENVEETNRFNTVFGTIRLHQSRKTENSGESG